MSERDPPAPDTMTVTCLTCHERIGVTLTADPQTIRCTFCEAKVKVPSREQFRQQQAARLGRPAAKVEGYAIAASGEAAKTFPVPAKPTFAGSAAETQPVPQTLTVECPTCHELIKATIGPNPGKISCTFCQSPVTVPDMETVAGWRAKEIRPRSSQEIGQYTTGPVPEAQPMRLGNVFDRLAEIRTEIAPAPPRWTFLSGVFTVPFRSEALVRWIYMSIGFSAILGIGTILKGLAAQFSGMATGVAAAFFLLPIIWIFFFTLSYTAACSLNIFESTAAGLDRIESWPEPNWRDWMTEFMYLGWIGAIPMAISYGLALLAHTQGHPVFATLPVAFFVLYPISLLSALEANTIWVPLTLPIVNSLARWWWCWLMFYGLAAMLVGVIVVAAGFLIASSLDAFLIGMGPVLAAAPLIYFRLLGRLAWRMTAKVRKTRKPKRNRVNVKGERGV